MAAGETAPRRDALHRQLKQLESDFARVQAELVALGPGQSLPGLFLVVEVDGRTAALSAGQVTEIVRLVEFAPLPGAPQHVLGTFLYRGEPVVAVDLASFLGHQREPSLDAHVIVLRASRPVALVVDRVRALTEGLLIDGEAAGFGHWVDHRIVASLCRSGDELLALLNLEPLLEGVPER